MRKRSCLRNNRSNRLSSNICSSIISASKLCSRLRQSINCRCLDHSRSQVAKEPHPEVVALFKSRVKILKLCPQEAMAKTHPMVKMPQAKLKVRVRGVVRDAPKTKQGLDSNKHAKKRKIRGKQSLPTASSHMLKVQVVQEMQVELQMKIKTKLMTVKLIKLSPVLKKMPMRLILSQNASV